ncbi:MAG: peptide maturation system protein family [Herbinix sp.]|jgi:peptide maturation system protein (TIGR04066 family)|nr:peptide maturation system protein family [Herbinix sp.]
MKFTDSKKIVVYPFSRDSLPLVRYLNKLNPSYNVTEIVSPKGWGFTGKDAGMIHLTPEIGILITNDIKQALEKSDTLFIVDSKKIDSVYESIIKSIEIAFDMGKDVICAVSLLEDDLESIQNSWKEFNVKFIYFPNAKYSSGNNKRLYHSSSRGLYNTKAPIIFISEMHEGLDGLEVLYAATYYFRKNGYKTTSLSEKNYSELLDIYTLPDFIQNLNVPDIDKIYQFNDFIKDIEEKEKPDIIFLQLPGGIMKYNDKITNNFGIIPYLISQAVQGDYIILCTPYAFFNDEYYKKLNDVFSYRYGVGLESFHMSNTIVDENSLLEKGEFSVFHIKQEEVDHQIQKIDNEIPVFNCINSIDSENMFHHLIETLTLHELNPIGGMN